MINTLYGLDALGTPRALFFALLIGGGFGFALERAGFSSSRRLAGVFYFTDMAVVKVMFSAMVTAMLGLSYLMAFGWIDPGQVFHMPTIYGAQIAGGLLFGVGFVMGAWCPGTAAAGLAAGRIDALVFLIGTVGGSILFNELYPIIGPFSMAGDQGMQLVYDSVGMSRPVFALLLTMAAVAFFWISELIERARTGTAPYLGTPFLKAFSIVLVVAAAGLSLLGSGTNAVATSGGSHGVLPAIEEQTLLAKVDAAGDHIEPEELADRLAANESDLIVVDVRSAADYAKFHIRGALNIGLESLPVELAPHKGKGLIVLYSNGMTHPAQARDSLQRQGFDNVYILTDGLQGFMVRCLKPVSLRAEPVSSPEAARIQRWRGFFLSSSNGITPVIGPDEDGWPRLVDVAWLSANVGRPDVVVLDLRPQPEYNSGHIPGALSLNIESLRGNIDGLPSMLLPVDMLAQHAGRLGLQPDSTVILVAGDKIHDSTLAGMAFERLGHRQFAILDGGFSAWKSGGYPLDMLLPQVKMRGVYPVLVKNDGFTVDAAFVVSRIGNTNAVIIDVRPSDYYIGKKSDEARAGHIPGAINRPYTGDTTNGIDKSVHFKPTAELAAGYAALIPGRDTEIIVHCRTGHQASQTFFVLKRLLGYSRVRWYDAGWTEWSARPDLPVAK